MMYGNIFFVKGKVAVAYSISWQVCIYENGELHSTLCVVKTYKELEKFVNEGGMTL